MRPVALGLRGRLAFSISLILLIALGVTYLAVYQGTGSELRNRTERDLERELESLQLGLGTGPESSPGEVTAEARALVENQSLGPTSRVMLIAVEGGGVVSNLPELLDEHDSHSKGGHDSRSLDEHDSRSISEAQDGYTSVDVDDVGEVRLLTREAILPNGIRTTIRVGQPLAPVDDALEGLSKTFVVVGFFSLILAAIAAWLLASSATKPMRRMAEVAEGVDAGDLTSRMPIGETRNDEVRRLAESFNGMLDRVEDAFDRQQSFVADASHDLRTPLTIIKGQLQVLARNPDPGQEEVRRVAALVEGASLRMERLIDDLLILAQADSSEDGPIELIDLEPLVKAEVEAFRETSDRKFEIRSVAAGEVRADREQMARVLSNLIVNSVRHTESGGTIRVSLAEADGNVLLTVEDDGPGVPEDLREHVFDRFSRLDASRSTAGSGLGLAIVRAIAESHGGSAHCDSSPLGGARFSIRFPLRRLERESG